MYLGMASVQQMSFAMWSLPTYLPTYLVGVSWFTFTDNGCIVCGRESDGCSMGVSGDCFLFESKMDIIIICTLTTG